MIFIPQAQTDAWLLEDIAQGDLTTRALGIGLRPGRMTFVHRDGGCVSGLAAATQMLHSLGLTVCTSFRDGEHAQPDRLLLTASGSAAALHQGWKAAQNIIEWSCGVSNEMASMLAILHKRHPNGHIACTRKTIPGTKLLATQAVLAAGGLIHRAGCGETILLFANHRRFVHDGHDWFGLISKLRQAAPEKKIVVEAETPEEALSALAAEPDVLQLDKFTPEQATDIAARASRLAPNCKLALTGGITRTSLERYLDCGITLFITSSPYYAPPADIQVRLGPDTAE
ncbi:ModD protein [Cedecea sp.]|jgi:molybdenum transport protein|uniref:ModD protein n=1 Tax=Cedecea sp. TaxID=1970739 RepID=UPI002F3FFB46